MGKSEISYENWKSSADKWIEAVKRVKGEQRFDNFGGFEGLDISGRCGYCTTRGPDDNCDLCHLFQTMTGHRRICNANDRRSTELGSHFECFLKVMYESDPDFKEALERAKIILQAILDDCPNRVQAKQDEINFVIDGT